MSFVFTVSFVPKSLYVLVLCVSKNFICCRLRVYDVDTQFQGIDVKVDGMP